MSFAWDQDTIPGLLLGSTLVGSKVLSRVGRENCYYGIIPCVGQVYEKATYRRANPRRGRGC